VITLKPMPAAAMSTSVRSISGFGGSKKARKPRNLISASRSLVATAGVSGGRRGVALPGEGGKVMSGAI
jgi:hypothetical protein